MTEREKMLMRREAFMAGAKIATNNGAWMSTPNFGALQQYAEAAYPLPTITRPRVVRSENGQWNFRVHGGTLEVQAANSHRGYWTVCESWRITPEFAALWADLFADPTEEVEDDGASSPSLPGASS